MQAGTVQGASEAAALNTLSEHGLYVISLQKIKEEGSGAGNWGPLSGILAFLHRVKRTDIMVFTRQLSTLLGAKIPLADALRTLHQQTISEHLRNTISQISNDVDTGFSLSQAIAKHPDVFSEFYLNMIRSAEVTGRMEEVMNYLADYLEKEGELVAKVRNAMIYPVFLVVLFGGVVIFLVTTILPQLKPVFEQSGVALPWFTQVLMNSGDFVNKWWWIFAVLAIVVIVTAYDYMRSQEGRALLDEVRLKIPLIGGMFKKVYVARFAESTSVLIRGGVPIAQAIEVTAHTISNVVYEDALLDASQAIRRGDLISTAISRYDEYFPPFVYQMIAVGETTGRLEELLKRVSDFYGREVDGLVNNLVELIQPIMIVFIGGAVGLLFGSIIIPIYNMAQAY